MESYLVYIVLKGADPRVGALWPGFPVRWHVNVDGTESISSAEFDWRWPEKISMVNTKLRQILQPGIAIRLNFAALSIIVYEPIKNYLKLFDIRLTQIPIFASRSNTSTANHHIFASPTIWLRYQSFGIRLDDESRSRTPLCWNLVHIHFKNCTRGWYGNIQE